MNEIVKHQQNRLSVTDHILLKPNALQVHEEELFNVVNAGIAKCYAHLNKAANDEQSLTYLVNEVKNAILNKYPAIRLQEIPTAFSKGIRGEYGEYFGLCVVTFEQFINGYLTSPERQKLVAEKNRLNLEEKKEPTADEKFTTAKELCLDAYELVKKGSPVGITGTAVYTFLNSLELIEQDYKKGVMKDAMEALLLEKAADVANCMELLKRRRLNAELESLRMNIANDAINQSQYDEVKRVCKKMILKNIMQDWSLEKLDLSELIESKREFYLAGHDKAKT